MSTEPLVNGTKFSDKNAHYKIIGTRFLFQKNVEEICEKGEIMGASLVSKKDALINISRQFVTENEALH